MFVYEPIRLDRPAFRQILLKKGKWSAIECEMYQAYLDGDDTIPYDALSYTWSGTHKTSIVNVDGKFLDVTENLYSALQHLRSETVDRVLWVDAICIDQSNERERGHQVQQMCKIYSQAEEVIVWLGQATRETNILLESLQRLEESSSRDGHGYRHWDLEQWTKFWLLVPRNTDSELRHGLNHLLRRPWFRRVWILQEIANAKKASILCGTKSVRAHIFALAPSLIGIKPERHCRAVLDIMPGSLREETWWSENRDLYNLLLKFSESQATDPRDKVYALLGISSDAWDTDNLRPDYTKDLTEVISDTSSFLFGPSDVSYGTMPDFLLDLTSRSVTIFKNLVNMSDVREVDIFLKRRGLEVPLSEDMIKAAAGNEKDGKAIMSLLLQERRNEFKFTPGVITAAGRNTTSKADIIGFLLQEFEDAFRVIVYGQLTHVSGDDMKLRKLVCRKTNSKNAPGGICDITWKASPERIRIAVEMLLLDRGVNADVEEEMHETVRKTATPKRCEAVVRLLAKPNTFCNAIWSPWTRPIAYYLRLSRIRPERESETSPDDYELIL